MNALDKVINEINKKYKADVIQKGVELVYTDSIPFSSPRANYMTYGGIPLGKATEFFGAEGGGKTTSALDVTAQAQKKALEQFEEEKQTAEQRLTLLKEKNNKTDQDEIKKLAEKLEQLEEAGPRRVVYIDAENTLDTEWAEKIGVDVESLILVRPQDHTAEQVLQMILDLIDCGQVILLVLDSVPMLVSQSLYEESLEKKTYAGIAGAITEFSRKVSPRISKNKTALLLINQVREDLANPYNQYNTPGGKALKHLYAVRLFFRKGSFIDSNNVEQPSKIENPAGNMVDITIVKTKVFKPDRRVGQYTINYMEGIDVLNDTVFMAIKLNYIEQSGAWYYIRGITEEELRFQGKTRLLEYLKNNEDVFEVLYNQVNNEIKE